MPFLPGVQNGARALFMTPFLYVQFLQKYSVLDSLLPKLLPGCCFCQREEPQTPKI